MPEPQNASSLHIGEFLELRRSDHWEYVRRIRSTSGAAFMIATTATQELILVEQMRIPAGQRVIELPAGIIGDDLAGEDPALAAVRELEEETGFRARQVALMHDAPTAAGLSSEWAWFFRLTQLERVHQGGGVDGEDITTHIVPLETAAAWLKTQRQAGTAVDARIFAALYWLHQETLA
jgi:ADP-ribose pyrophosphatase